MNRVSTRIALLTVVGVLSAVPPAFAAPNGMNNNNNTTAGQNDANGGSQPLNCALPENRHNPLCLQKNYNNGTKGSGDTNNGSNRPGPNGSSTNNQTNNNDHDNRNGMWGKGYNGPKSGTFNFNQQDRNFFRQHFRGFNFGNFSFFLSPNFSITIGTNVPNRYHAHLQRVPASIYRYYPWFRGYFFFVDRRGDFVIVNPRNFRIVAVL